MGKAEGNWKKQLHNHRQSFNNKKRKNNTALSNYLRDLKENQKNIPNLTLSINRFAPRGFKEVFFMPS